MTRNLFLTFSVAVLTFLSISCGGGGFSNIATLPSELGLPRMPLQEDFPEADGVYILDDDNVRMKVEDSRLVTYETIHRVKKLFKNIDDQATVVIYMGDEEKLTNLRARTIKADGTPVELKAGDFYTSTGSGGGEMFYTDRTTVKFTFPAIEKNCLVEYSYTKLKQRPFVTDVWEIQHYLPTLRNTYTLTVPAILLQKESLGGYDWSWRYLAYGAIEVGKPSVMKPLNPGGSTYSQEVVFSWSLKSIPAFQPEPLMPSHEQFMAYVKFAPSEWKDWNDISSWYYDKIFKPQMVITDAIAHQAKELTQSCRSETEKIQSIYRFVQSFRYVAIALGIGSIQPTAPQTVLDRQYGDCKDKSILLLSLLTSAGIASNPVLVLTQDDGVLDPHFPSWNFNHMIVQAKTRNGDVFWLDGTARYCPLGKLPWQCEGINVLVINNDGNSHLEKTPFSNHMVNETTIDVQADISAEQPGKFDVTIRYAGEHNFRNRNFFVDRTEQEMKEFCKALVVDDFVGATIDRYSFSPLDSLDTELVLKFGFSVPNALRKQADLYFLTIDPFKLFSDMTWLVKENRRYPLTFHYPRITKKQVTIRYPKDVFAVRNVPENFSKGDDNFSYSSSTQASQPGQIVSSEVFSIKSREIAPGKYAQTRKFFESVQNKISEKLVLTKR